jgi:hypothetical protein
MELVLKVGNQQTVSGLDSFEKEHPPNLVSFSHLYFSVLVFMHRIDS